MKYTKAALKNRASSALPSASVPEVLKVSKRLRVVSRTASVNPWKKPR